MKNKGKGKAVANSYKRSIVWIQVCPDDGPFACEHPAIGTCVYIHAKIAEGLGKSADTAISLPITSKEILYDTLHIFQLMEDGQKKESIDKLLQYSAQRISDILACTDLLRGNKKDEASSSNQGLDPELLRGEKAGEASSSSQGFAPIDDVVKKKKKNKKGKKAVVVDTVIKENSDGSTDSDTTEIVEPVFKTHLSKMKDKGKAVAKSYKRSSVWIQVCPNDGPFVCEHPAIETCFYIQANIAEGLGKSADTAIPLPTTSKKNLYDTLHMFQLMVDDKKKEYIDILLQYSTRRISDILACTDLLLGNKKGEASSSNQRLDPELLRGEKAGEASSSSQGLAPIDDVVKIAEGNEKKKKKGKKAIVVDTVIEENSDTADKMKDKGKAVAKSYKRSSVWIQVCPNDGPFVCEHPAIETCFYIQANIAEGLGKSADTAIPLPTTSKKNLYDTPHIFQLKKKESQDKMSRYSSRRVSDIMACVELLRGDKKGEASSSSQGLAPIDVVKIGEGNEKKKKKKEKKAVVVDNITAENSDDDEFSEPDTDTARIVAGFEKTLDGIQEQVINARKEAEKRAKEAEKRQKVNKKRRERRMRAQERGGESSTREEIEAEKMKVAVDNVSGKIEGFQIADDNKNREKQDAGDA